MLKYKKVFENNKIVKYEYYPENNPKKAVIEFNKLTEEPKIISLSDEKELDWYRLHLFSKLREFARKKEYKEEGMISWY